MDASSIVRLRRDMCLERPVLQCRLSLRESCVWFVGSAQHYFFRVLEDDRSAIVTFVERKATMLRGELSLSCCRSQVLRR